jgi:hypothetical protein
MKGASIKEILLSSSVIKIVCQDVDEDLVTNDQRIPRKPGTREEWEQHLPGPDTTSVICLGAE